MERYLWKFYWDCGRQGSVSSLFVATEQEVSDALGSYVYFGEILGKHSEVSGTIDEGEITKIDLDSETVEKVATILGNTWNGRNPLHYIQYECRICGDSYSEDEYSDKAHLNDRICRYCEAEEKE